MEKKKLESYRMTFISPPGTNYEKYIPNKMWEVWIEGYAATGESSKAHKLGEVLTKTFDDAVLILTEGKVDKDEKQEDGLRRMSEGNLCSWACGFYDNEEEARKSFG